MDAELETLVKAVAEARATKAATFAARLDAVEADGEAGEALGRAEKALWEHTAGLVEAATPK